MKPASFIRRAQGLFVIPLLTLLLLPDYVQAQSADYPAYGESQPLYSGQELAQMLAPVALYPDALLAQVLMASTYPVEVVEAERWIRINSGLKDEDLDAALLRRNWDPSVKALTHFPSILTLMSERLSETTELGNAFLAQEDDVMTMVQELRAQAYAHGTLRTNTRQQVIVERQTILIQPINPRVVYVPYYDPFHVYGSWRYSAYPPYYWGPPGVHVGYGIGYWPEFYFNFTFGNWSYFDWQRRVIFVDVNTRPRFVHHEQWIVRTGTWKHAPVHRRGVAYRDHATASRFSQPDRAYRSDRQERYRASRPSHQLLNRHSAASTTTRAQQQVTSRTTTEHRTIQSRTVPAQTTEHRRTVERVSTEHRTEQPGLREQKRQTRSTEPVRQQSREIVTAQKMTTQQRLIQPQRQQSAQRTGTEPRQQRQETTERRSQQPQVKEQNRQTRSTEPVRQQSREVVTAQADDNNRNMRTETRRPDSQQMRSSSWRDQRSSNSNDRDSRDNRSRGTR